MIQLLSFGALPSNNQVIIRWKIDAQILSNKKYVWIKFYIKY